MTAPAPSGVVTFLFTDIEGSTRRWELDAESMRAALVAHDEVLRAAIEAHGGFLFSHTGYGVVAAFRRRIVSKKRPETTDFSKT
jgi:class 3 adenylate cyclase